MNLTSFFQKDTRTPAQKKAEKDKKHSEIFKTRMDTLLRTINTCCTRGCKQTRTHDLQQWEKDQIQGVITNLLEELDHYVSGKPVSYLQKGFSASGEDDMLCRVIFQIEQAIRDLPRGGVRSTLGQIWDRTSGQMREGAHCRLYDPSEQEYRDSLHTPRPKPSYNQLCEDKPVTIFQKELGEEFYL